MNLIIESDHRTVIRGRLSLGIAFWAFLGALAACAPSEPEESPEARGAAAQARKTLAAGPQLSPELPVNPVAPSTASHENTVVAAGNGLARTWR